MTQENRNAADSNVPKDHFGDARAIGAIDWLVHAVFMASALTESCAHCIAEEVAQEVKRTLDGMPDHSEGDEHDK